MPGIEQDAMALLLPPGDDKAPAYGAAIAALKKSGQCPPETEHRQVKY